MSLPSMAGRAQSRLKLGLNDYDSAHEPEARSGLEERSVFVETMVASTRRSAQARVRRS
jgi:hypothetical protein